MIAREIAQRKLGTVMVMEKEPVFGLHASGRNSGVLHSGIYYPSDSLKAKFCIAGNQFWTSFCDKKQLPILKTGKVVVARSESEIETLNTLYERGQSNGAILQRVGESQLATVEPLAKTTREALVVSSTSVVDPKRVVAAVVAELDSDPLVSMRSSCQFLGVESEACIRTSQGNVAFSTFINAAGAFADQVAHSFDVGRQFRLIPFKGVYRKVVKSIGMQVNGSIYPVPDIRNPFLGVHFTRSVSGDVYLGPTAMPAFGREAYGGVRLTLESLQLMIQDAVLFMSNEKFRSVALTEPKKYVPYWFYQDAKRLVKHLAYSDVLPSPKVGIRPQLVDWETKELVMDFKVLRSQKHIHVLNAISPAFTCAVGVSKHVVDMVVE